VAVTPEESARHIVRIVRERIDVGEWGMLQWLDEPFHVDPYEPEDVQPGLADALNRGWIEVRDDWVRVLPKGNSEV
jgi:hypothetical protein